MTNIQNRIDKLKQTFATANIDGMLVTNLTNVRYLSGFSGSAGQLLILPDENYFFTDGRYIAQSKSQVHDFKINIIGDTGYAKFIANLEILKPGMKLGFETSHLTVSQFNAVKSEWPDVEFVETDSMVELIAAVKDVSEIEALKTAIEITDKTFEDIIPDLKVGAIENQIAAKMSYLFKMNGGEGDSFDSIVASGFHSAMPHAHPSDKKLESGDFLVLDFGAMYDGYHADMTRTVVIGEASERHHEIYQIVLDAQLAAIAVARAGKTGAEIDAVCRDIIEAKGYGKEFSHSTGHGIGLEVHTHPRLSKMNHEPLLENYVVTIEPGIYIADFGGVRIEDDIWLHSDGNTVLNRSTKEMLVLK